MSQFSVDGHFATQSILNHPYSTFLASAYKRYILIQLIQLSDIRQSLILSALFRTHCWNASGVAAFGKNHYNVANTLVPIRQKDKIYYRDGVCVALNGSNNVTYQAGIIFKND